MTNVIPLDTIALAGLVAVSFAGLVFSSMGYILTVSQTLMFAVEMIHSLIAGALIGALIESITGVIPTQVVIFLYSMAVSALVAELVKRKVPRDSVIAFITYLSSVATIASLWSLVYTAPLGVSKALGALWGSVLLVTPSDLAYLALATLVVLLVIELFDLELKYISFDPDLAFVSGLNVRAYYYLVYATASLSLSATIKIYGAVISGVLVVLPSVIAQYLLKRVDLPVFLSLGLSISISGYVVSLLLNAQTSLCIGLISLGILTLGTAFRWFHGR